MRIGSHEVLQRGIGRSLTGSCQNGSSGTGQRTRLFHSVKVCLARCNTITKLTDTVQAPTHAWGDGARIVVELRVSRVLTNFFQILRDRGYRRRDYARVKI